jgi:hypothetical protein
MLQKANILDRYYENVVSDLGLDAQGGKIVCYLYGDEKEKLILTGVPGGGGYTYGGNIHVLGIGIVKHESIHVLWKRSVGAPPNNFFNEGICKYYEFKVSPEAYKAAVEIAKQYVEEPIEQWADETINFFSTPSLNGWPVAYPVSGLFVRYLIEEYGLEKFKEFYMREDTGEAFLELYNLSLRDALSAFKKVLAGL